MPYWRECPRCGCHLDPGEVCDCEKKEGPAKKAGGAEKKGIRLSWDVKTPKGRPSSPCPFK